MQDKGSIIPLAVGFIIAIIIFYTAYTSVLSLNNNYDHLNREPLVTLIYPKGGEELSGTVAIRWTASDPDGDPLIIRIEYTSDPPPFCPTCPPPTWNQIAVGLENTGEYRWDTSSIPDGSYIIKVVVSDGVRETSTESDWITVNNTRTT